MGISPSGTGLSWTSGRDHWTKGPGLSGAGGGGTACVPFFLVSLRPTPISEENRIGPSRAQRSPYVSRRPTGPGTRGQGAWEGLSPPSPTCPWSFQGRVHPPLRWGPGPSVGPILAAFSLGLAGSVREATCPQVGDSSGLWWPSASVDAHSSREDSQAWVLPKLTVWVGLGGRHSLGSKAGW